MIRRVLPVWLPLAAVTSALCVIVYFVSQQVWRASADDPQIQIAHDLAAALDAGTPIGDVVPSVKVAMDRSLAPFVTVLDDRGAIVATSGTLHGQPRPMPIGVVNYVRDHGEETVTWQPEPGVRIAAAVVKTSETPARYVVTGRSLRLTEERVSQFRSMIAFGWAVTLVGLCAIVAGVQAVFPARQ
jgi:hypothetical protein